MFAFMTVEVLLGLTSGMCAAYWLFSVFGTRDWPIDKKARLAQVFAVLLVVMIALLLPRVLSDMRDSMALADPTRATIMALLAAALAVVGGVLGWQLLQSRHL